MKERTRPSGILLARVGACLALAAVLFCRDAIAATDCSVAATGVAFGTYDTLSTIPNDSSATVTVVCTYVSGGAQQIAYSATLSTGSSGTYASRQLHAGALALNYNLFTNTTRTSVWGNGLGGTSLATGSFTIGPGVGNGRREVIHPVYGRIPARQDVLDGLYSDTIVVTLTF